MRIVSLVPSWTEWLFDLGCGDDVVGLTTLCGQRHTLNFDATTNLEEFNDRHRI